MSNSTVLHPSIHLPNPPADLADYDEAIRGWEHSQQLISEQERLDHEIAVVQGLVDRNGFGAVIDWLLAYAAEEGYQISQAQKRQLEQAKTGHTFFAWTESNSFDLNADFQF